MLASIFALTLVADQWEVLVFTKTAGFRHGSIAAGVAAIQELGKENGFSVTHTEDSSRFDENLARYRVVVFLNTTGDVLSSEQEVFFEKYHRGGGGFVGIHSASDTEYEWEFYGQVVGAYFASHPAVQDAVVRVLDASHAATKHLPKSWSRKDEWYDFRAQPLAHCKILCELDVSSYNGRKMTGQQATAWCHEKFGGRAFYTGGGHTSESFSEPLFRGHLLGALRWAAKVVD